MQLDPSESINNMGKLRVDVIDAKDLPSADRNGKSDPYCKFDLNGVEVYKTKVIKKTLTPTWNESFEVDVPSRTGADMVVNIYDYDFADKPDFLGSASINLEALDPFKATESQYILDGKSGSVRIRLLFRPDYVQRMKQGTSTLTRTFTSAPGRIVTGVAGAPLKGVGKGASFLRKGLFGKKDEDSSANGSVPAIIESIEEGPETTGTESPRMRPVTSNGPSGSSGTNGHSRTRSFGATSTRSSHVPGAGSGTASFTVVGASGYPPSSDLYVSISQISPKDKTVGKTKHYKSSSGQWTFDESFQTQCTADAQFKIEVKGEHMFGSDEKLGEHVYFVDESGAGGSKELIVGPGTITIKSSFQSAESSHLSAGSPRAGVRRSFLGKREGRTSREVTPNP